MTKRRKAVVAVTTGLANHVARVVLHAGAAGATPEADSLGDLKLIKTKTSLLGKHYWYQQTFKGLPVIDGYYAKHVTTGGGVEIADGRDAVPANLDVSAKVAPATATQSANAVVTAKAQRARIAAPGKSALQAPAASGAAQLAVIGGPHARLVWAVTSRSAEGVSRSLVDADTGSVVESKVVSDNVDGRGSVFDPNPVVSEKNEKLTDMNDKNQDVLFLAQKNIVLRNLDGSGKLNGAFVNIKEGNGGLAQSKTNTFVYQRANNKLRAGDGLLPASPAQEYIQHAGLHRREQRVPEVPHDRTHATTTRSTTRDGPDHVRYRRRRRRRGRRGHLARVRSRDPGRPGPGFGATEEAGAIGEGFGDYWAFTMSSAGQHQRPRPAVPASPTGTRRRTRHRHAALPAPHRHGARLPGDLTARCTTTVRSGRARCGTSTTRSAGTRPTR